jgi:peptidylprolyl isomerase
MTSKTTPLRWIVLAALVLALSFSPVLSTALRAAGQVPNDNKKEKAEKENEVVWTRTESGLQYRDLKEGKGKKPRNGQTCVVEYTVWLWVNEAKGKKCDSSKDHGRAYDFVLGTDPQIKGMIEGLSGMKVGGKRELIIPPELAYDKKGIGGVVPPDATLFMEIELKELR